jgi:hypothetical protein
LLTFVLSFAYRIVCRVPIGVLCATLANNLAERTYTASASNSSIVALLQRIWQVQTEKRTKWYYEYSASGGQYPSLMRGKLPKGSTFAGAEKAAVQVLVCVGV